MSTKQNRTDKGRFSSKRKTQAVLLSLGHGYCQISRANDSIPNGADHGQSYSYPISPQVIREQFHQ